MSYQEQLECPVCLCVRGGCHIYQCQAGHLVCAPCFKHLPQQCPTCRGQYDFPARRNLLAEELVSGATFAVSCGHLACQQMFVGEELEVHMTECLHREVPCPFSACNGVMALDNVIGHVLGHQATLVQFDEDSLELDLGLQNMNQTSGWWMPMVGQVNDQRFYIQCLFRHNVFMAWVKVEEGREEAALWKANFNIPSLNKKISCETNVFPIDMSNDEIIASGDCLLLGEREMQRFFVAGKIHIDLQLDY